MSREMSGEITLERKKERILWPDMLRVMAAGAVVLMHTLTGAVDILNVSVYEEGRLMLVVMDLVTWCVPIYLVISGYLFLDPGRERKLSVMIGRYCVRIVLALLIFGIPFALAELVLIRRELRIGMLWESVKMVLTMQSWSHLWYLYLILLLYLLTPGIRWCLKRIPLWGIVGAMAVLTIGSSLLPFWNKVYPAGNLPVLPDAMIYGVYYLFGHLLHRFDGKQNDRLAKGCGCGVILLAAFMVYSRLGAGFGVQMAYSYPPTVLLVIFLILWAQKKTWKENRITLLCRKLSRLSFTVYLIHPVFLHILYKVVKITLTDYPLLLSLPLGWILVTAASVAAAWILCRIPWLSKNVL